MSSPSFRATDAAFLDRLFELAVAGERAGNLPIAAVLAEGSTILAEGINATLAPTFHPGRHAEVEALRLAPESAWRMAERLTLYTSLEPCVMCFGAIVLHRLGRVVYAAADPLGGALSLLPHLPRHVRAKAEAIDWRGPVEPQRFDPLARRALELGEPQRRRETEAVPSDPGAAQ